MSLYEFWPAFPKSIDEKAWQKKKGIVKTKETGISEKIAALESAQKKLKLHLYNEVTIDIKTLKGAEKAANDIFADANNMKAYFKTCSEFAEHCRTKAAEFKKSVLIPKAVREYLETMASDADDHAAAVKKHIEQVTKEVEDAKNSLGEEKNVPAVKEKIKDVEELLKEWDKLIPVKMKQLEEMELELTDLTKEMDFRLEGKVDKPAAELKPDFKRIQDEAQSMQDVMLGKKAYAILKAVKEIRGLTKTIKDKEFTKDVADPFEKRANKFLEQREKLNVHSSNLLSDAGLSYSLLEKGLKDENEVMREVEKFAEIFYDESSPNSVAKTREQIELVATLTKDILLGMKKTPVEKDGLRRLKAQADDAVVKFETATFALRGAIKTSARLTRGRFEKHPMIGNSLKKMATDVDGLQKLGKKNKEIYEKVVPVVEKTLVG